VAKQSPYRKKTRAALACSQQARTQAQAQARTQAQEAKWGENGTASRSISNKSRPSIKGKVTFLNFDLELTFSYFSSSSSSFAPCLPAFLAWALGDRRRASESERDVILAGFVVDRVFVRGFARKTRTASSRRIRRPLMKSDSSSAPRPPPATAACWLLALSVSVSGAPSATPFPFPPGSN